MSYLVLARKYRPQTFDDIVGQEHVTRTLANAFAKQRVHHAFLFCGARGVGKTTAARVLAKALCCEQGPTATPCGVCSACQTITAGTAVDYFEIDGASNNSVDNIRELRDGVRYQPAQLRRKVYVIDEVHMLSVAAFNALLKTLEEPPPHATFIFATTEVHKVPITILSRCQRYDFKLVPTARLLKHLESILVREKIDCEPGALGLLAREAGGSVRDALSLTDQVIAFAAGERVTEAKVAEGLGVADRALLDTLLGSVVRHEPAAALMAIDGAVGRGVDIAHLARTFLGYLRDAAVVHAVAEADGIVDATADEVRSLRALVAEVPRAQLMALFDRFANACEQLKESPAPRLIVEVALIDMAGAEPLAPIAEMVERLERLESRLRGTAPPAKPGASKASTSAVASSASTIRPSATPVAKPAPRAVAASSVSPAASEPGLATPAVSFGGPQATSSASTTPSQLASAPTTPPPPRSFAPAASPTSTASSVSAPPPPATKPTWPQVVAALPISLSGVFTHARPLGWSERILELGFTSDFQAQIARDQVESLKKTIATLTSAPVDVKISIVAEAPGVNAALSIAEAEKGEKRELRSRREEEARSHPVTDAVIKTFGATIKEIKVDG